MVPPREVPQTSAPGRNPSLGAIFLTIFLDLLGFGLVIPFLAEEARDTFHTTAFVATLLGSVYSLMQFLFVPVWGRVSDRVGRRPVILWSVAATGASMVGLGVALAYGASVAWLFAARVASGIATANLGTASAYIADITAPEERARGMGLIGMAFGLGFILGPGVGGLLAAHAVNGRHGPLACFAAAGLSVVNLIWVYFGVAESLPEGRRARGTARRLGPMDLALARTTFADRSVARAILVNFVIVLSFTNLDQTFRFFTKDCFAMSPTQTGFVFAFIGVVAALVQGGLIRRLSKRHGEAALIRAGTALQVVAFAALAASALAAFPSGVRLLLLFASTGVLAFGNGLTQPSTSAYISRRAPADAQGSTLGTSQSMASLARMMGPATGGLLYGVGPSAPYAVAAVGMLVALGVALTLEGSGAASQN